VCPFASFVRFSHAENEYLNQGVATVREAAQVIKETTEASPLVLYPGDVWVPGEDWDTEASLKKYDDDYNSANWDLQPASDPVPIDALQEQADTYLASARKHGNPIAIKLWQHRLEKRLGRPLKLSISLFDSNTKLLFDWDSGISVLKRETEHTDLTLSSSSLSYILKYEWGFGTVRVNGRYRATTDGRTIFSLIFPFGTLHSVDKSLGWKFLWRHFASSLLKRISRRAPLETEDEPSFLGMWFNSSSI
jgi:UDP-MurNAc hydroxylase